MDKTDDFPCCAQPELKEWTPRPVNLNPNLVGHVVSIQSFKFDEDREPGTIDIENGVEKFVGVLVAYATVDGVITIVLEGFEDPFFIDTAVRHYELYV